MDQQHLAQLLLKPEGPSLEFKREFYKNYSEKGEAGKRQRGEFIKDILSLANGDASTAGDTAYLIFGAGDELTMMVSDSYTMLSHFCHSWYRIEPPTLLSIKEDWR